jgi:hypothetical protein
MYGFFERFRECVNIFTDPEQAMHPATLQLKLKCLLTAKLMAHHSAMFMPTTRQLSASMVLAFSALFDVRLLSLQQLCSVCRED